MVHSAIGNESLFIVDDSPDNQLESARRQAPLNDPVFLNKFEGAQMEHDRQEAKRKQEMQVLRGDPHFIQLEKEKAAAQKRAY